MSTPSQFYPSARAAAAGAGIAWTSGTVKVLLMADGYIPDFTNQFLSDVPAGSIITTSPNVTNRSNVGGVLSGDTINFGTLSDLRQAGSLIFYKDTGTPSTSALLVYVGTASLSGMPEALNGFNYYVYKNVVGGWFAL